MLLLRRASLEIAPLAIGEILQLATHAVEGVSHRYPHILIHMRILGIAGGDQLGARDGDVYSDVEGLSLAMKIAGVAVMRFDHHPAARYAVVDLFELEGFISDALFERFGMV